MRGNSGLIYDFAGPASACRDWGGAPRPPCGSVAGQGWGEPLLQDAVKLSLELRDKLGVNAVRLDALQARAAKLV